MSHQQPFAEKTKGPVDHRADELHRAMNEANFQRQDALLAKLLVVEWIASICIAVWTTSSWERLIIGDVHVHVWASALLGFSFICFPIACVWLSPGAKLTRYSLTIAQMLFSGLLVHLMNGRIEAHFHIFGSLALLAFYRDWKVLAVGSIVVTGDHLVRGLYWPESIYGSTMTGFGRTIEHGFWVLFEDVFLIHACWKSQSEMRSIAVHRAKLEFEKETVEQRVEERTQELEQYGNFLRGVIDGIDAGICILDENGVIVSTNANWVHVGNSLDAEKSRIGIGVNYIDVCQKAVGESAEGAYEIAARLREVLSGNLRSFTSEYPCHSPEEQKWFQVRVSHLLDQGKHGAVIVHLDISQRMKALADLQEQKNQVDRLAFVAQYTTNSVLIADADRKIVWANEGSSRALGCLTRDLLGRSVADVIFSKQESIENRESLLTAMERKVPYRSELTFKVIDGRERILDTEVQPIVIAGRLHGFIVNQTDTSEQASLRDRLEGIFAAMGEGILLQDIDGRILDCNPEAESIFGVPRDQLVGKIPDGMKWSTQFEDGSDWPTEDHPSMVTLRTGQPIRDAIMGIRQNCGGIRWISINTQVIRTRLGSSNAVVSSFTDVTTRREQLQRLDLTISGAGLGVWDWNIETGSVRFNTIFARVLGYRSDEMLPTRAFWESLIHPDDRERASSQLKQHLAGTLLDFRCEYRLKCRDGKWHWVLVSGRVVEKDAEGNPRRLAGVHVDIENLKEMESRLRESENRMRLIFENAMDAVVLLDNQGDILDWNLQAEKIFQYSRDEAVGRNLRQLIATQDRPEKGFEDFDIIFPTKDNCVLRRRMETQAIRKDRATLTIDLAITPVQFQNENCYSVFLRDVTQQRALERQVSQTQRLESIGQLASGVAHEINTPVQFVNDSVYFLRDGVQDLFGLIDELQQIIRSTNTGLSAKDLMKAATTAQEEADLDYLSDNMPKALDRSIEGLTRVAEIVRSMKEFSHQGSGEMNRTDINHSLTSTLIVAKNEYKYVADIELELGDIPDVNCQRGEINQVFLNLIVNAAHAVGDAVRGTNQKGKILIRTRADGEYVEITIADSGTGIPERVRDRIFEPFFTTKEVGKGTGQGLALAHNFVVNHHCGTLRFQTEVGKGTMFIVRLPILGPKVPEGVDV